MVPAVAVKHRDRVPSGFQDKLPTMLKEQLIAEIARAARAIYPTSSSPISLAPADNSRHDYQTETAVRIAAERGSPGEAGEIARALVAALAGSTVIASAVALPDGRIDLLVAEDAWTAALDSLLEAGSDYGANDDGAGRPVLVEFVSANPNAPLSVTHARGGVVGDIIAALLTATGYRVQREFYVNDAESSKPLRAFTRAVLAAYRERCSPSELSGGENEGAFVRELADALYEAEGDRFASLPERAVLPEFHDLVLAESQNRQRDALAEFGIRFDRWSRESELGSSGAVAETMEMLRASGHAEVRDGAFWLLSRRLGDDVDRVLLRADGGATYLAGDLAYHRAKLHRGFERLIDVWSADHSGYISRTRAGIAALGFDPECLDVVVFQTVRVLKDGTFLNGSDGAAASVTLKDIVEHAGREELRFQLALGSPADPLDLDIDAALSKAGSLPVILAFLNDTPASGEAVRSPSDNLSGAAERRLLRTLFDFPSVVAQAAAALAPQTVAAYAARLADDNAGWAKVTRAGIDSPLRQATAQALRNTLVLLGIPPTITPPEATD